MSESTGDATPTRQLWFEVLKASPQGWKPREVERYFTEVTGVRPLDATAEDLQRYRVTLANRQQAKVTIRLDIDTLGLRHSTDSNLAALYWYATDGFAGDESEDLAERISHEIIRRWLNKTPPGLWSPKGDFVQAGAE